MTFVANLPPVPDTKVQSPSRGSGRQLGNVVGTIVLLVAHFIFFPATFTVLGLMVMVTDSCGTQKVAIQPGSIGR
jgi:hypothetical protein